jgi:hypothetical protein
LRSNLRRLVISASTNPGAHRHDVVIGVEPEDVVAVAR